MFACGLTCCLDVVTVVFQQQQLQPKRGQLCGRKADGLRQ